MYKKLERLLSEKPSSGIHKLIETGEMNTYSRTIKTQVLTSKPLS